MNDLIDTFANRLSYALTIRNMKPIELAEATKIDKSKMLDDELISLKQNTFNPKEIVKCNYNLVKSKNIDKYINIQSIIVDSNLLGYFIILKDDKDIDMDLINNIKKVINDIVN